MTDEESFQAQLDETPFDMTVRAVFADWLQEQNDLRADGYRALARCAKMPRETPESLVWGGMDWVDPGERGYIIDHSTGIPIWKDLPFTWVKIRARELLTYTLPWYWFDVVELHNPESAEVAAAAKATNARPPNGFGEDIPALPLVTPPRPTGRPTLPFKTRREAEDAAALAFRYMPAFYRLPLLRGEPR